MLTLDLYWYRGSRRRWLIDGGGRTRVWLGGRRGTDNFGQCWWWSSRRRNWCRKGRGWHRRRASICLFRVVRPNWALRGCFGSRLRLLAGCWLGFAVRWTLRNSLICKIVPCSHAYSNLGTGQWCRCECFGPETGNALGVRSQILDLKPQRRREDTPGQGGESLGGRHKGAGLDGQLGDSGGQLQAGNLWKLWERLLLGW